MSSYRKAAPRRTHKERAQPLVRQHMGLLEKKKDYVLRARDYHKKQDAIQTLKQKAAFKNPDEFYFGMINSKTEKGAHIKQRGESHDHDSQVLMKTQDSNYVRLQSSINRKKIERLRDSIHIVEDEEEVQESDGPVVEKSKGNHTIWVADENVQGRK